MCSYLLRHEERGKKVLVKICPQGEMRNAIGQYEQQTKWKNEETPKEKARGEKNLNSSQEAKDNDGPLPGLEPGTTRNLNLGFRIP